MGGGDLNMKKSWHPVLLVNQERVWKAEKAANEEKKQLAQLRKEREEERQLAELQRLQESTTGKKRVDKLDWMYAAPGNEGGALGGAKIGEREMEEYLLGKKRVDEALGQGDKNIGNASREFIAVQHANNPRDTAAKIREDPLLAIKRQEQAALAALMNRPDIRRKLKAAQKDQGKEESKEERRARKKAEKEERKKSRHESKSSSRKHHDYRDSGSPRSDYSEDERDRREYKRHRRDSYSRSYDSRDDRRRDKERSTSPKRERDVSHSRRDRERDESPRRSYRDDSPRRSSHSDERHRRESRNDDRVRRDDRERIRDDPRIPPPRLYPNSNGHGNGHGVETREVKPHHSRPSAMDMADRPTTSSSYSRPPPQANDNSNGNGNGNDGRSLLDEQRAARLAAMSSSANTLYDERAKTLAQRAEEERIEKEKEEKMRKKYGQEEASAGFFKAHNNGMNLGESLGRRAGKGLLKDI